MYLASILALCALLCAPAEGSVGGEPGLFALSSAQPRRTQQEPAQPDPSKPDSPKPAPQETKPADKPEPNQATPEQQAPAEAAPAAQPVGQKPSAAAKKHRTEPKHPSPAANQDPKKTVIRHGSTLEPAMQLTPGMTEEQAARQRQTTKQLLSSTEAALHKLNGRILSDEERATVAQIRKFVEQSGAADKTGDLQRAYKLAMKAQLLSDALMKP
jgi:hypothetical protein